MLKGTIKESSELLFVEQLKKHGYPDSAIVTEWRTQKACIDIVVFDTETNIPLMIVECKSVNNPHSLEAAVNQLRRYNDVMDYPVRTYAAIYTGSGSFDFYDFTEKIKDASTPISQCGPTNIPAYETIKTGAKSKFIDSQKKKKRKYITGLRIACWGIIPIIINRQFISVVIITLADELSCPDCVLHRRSFHSKAHRDTVKHNLI